MPSRNRYLSVEQAARVYDRVGRWQDTQAFYERRAVDVLVREGRFDTASDVVEVGCGTGALAERLLSTHLGGGASYVGLDVSPRMVALTRRRLRAWPDRADVLTVDGRSPWPLPDASVDRVVAAYVLDLMPPPAVAAFLAETTRVLRPEGLLAAVSLAPGTHGVTRLVSAVWSALWGVDARLTGGCRPVELAAQLPPRWRREVTVPVTSYAVTSEVLIAGPATDVGDSPSSGSR